MNGPKFSYVDHIRAYEKSVVLSGANVLFPVPESLTNGFAHKIRAAIIEAEGRAYVQGLQDAREQMRKALGM